MKDLIAQYRIPGTDCEITIAKVNWLAASGKQGIGYHVDVTRAVAGPSSSQGFDSESDAYVGAERAWAWQMAHKDGHTSPFRGSRSGVVADAPATVTREP